MELRLVRHATLAIAYAGLRLLLDPQLDPAGARDAIEGTPEPRRNPLVGLPAPAEEVVRDVDAILVTHLHGDHLDATALALLDPALPVLCQPADAAALRDRGRRDVRPVGDAGEHRGIAVARTGGRHGTGDLGERLGPVSGFVLRAADEPVLYVAGDTIWCDEVARALDEHRPDVVVVNAGGARFLEGDPITMTADDVAAVARHAPGALVVAVHCEAINHCLESRTALQAGVDAAGVGARVRIPADGETV